MAGPVLRARADLEDLKEGAEPMPCAGNEDDVTDARTQGR